MEIEARLESHIELKHGVLHNIPVNCTFHHSKVDLQELEARPADASMIVELLVILAHNIAQKHELVSAVFAIVPATVGKLELLSYEINFRMPADVIGDLTQLIRLKKVNPYRVVRVTCPFIEGDGLSIRLTVDSNSNPFIRTVYTSSHLEIEGLGIRHDDLYTEELAEDDKRGATKRKRRQT